MRIRKRDKLLWLVTDPTADSGVEDIMMNASLEDLFNQIRGGLSMDSNPTLFTSREEAEVETYGRLVALRASQAISRMGPEAKFQAAKRIQVLGPDGTVLFDADL